MKLSKVIFTHPVLVFPGDTVSVLSTDQNGSANRVDSIEVTPLGLVITRGELQAWVPSESAEGGQVVVEKGGKAK